VISDNLIKDNRYGITVLGGNATVEISENIIEDNNTQGNPNLGGSGINLNSSTNDMVVTATFNQIRGNIWGITLQGEASINLGDNADVVGGNVFSENGNNDEIYALYNNTPNTINALHNCWVEGSEVTLAEAEVVIFHQQDDASLGEVLFDPVSCNVAGTDDFFLDNLSFYPNPATNSFRFISEIAIENITILNANGAQVLDKNIQDNQTQLNFNLPSGLYFVVFKTSNSQGLKKLIIK
jgi:hypothetical protein